MQSTIFDTLKDKGYICSCCGQYVKQYTRSFNCNMALVLIALLKHEVFEFVHIEKWLQSKGYQRCGDFSYLIHYGFLERAIGEREDGSKRNGYYKITGRGIAFADGKITASEKFKMFNGKFMGFEGKQINVQEALGRKFNYNTLMGKTEQSISEQTS